jgi:putative transposase
MKNVPAISPCAQMPLEAVSEAVTDRILESINTLRADDGAGLSSLLDSAILDGIDRAFSAAAHRHAVAVLGAERSERAGARAGYRSGMRSIQIAGPLGPLRVALVKSRAGLLRPDFLKDAARFSEGIKQLAVRLWSYGLSYRSISDVSADTLKAPVGRTSIATWVQDAEKDVLSWLSRPVPSDIRYLMLDGMFVSKKRVTAGREPVLVAVSITDAGTRHVLDVLPASGETFEAWSTCLHRLKGRGLDVSKLRLAITDGCSGLIKALQVELPAVPRQRCTVHKTRNVLQAAAPAVKSAAAKQATAIWNAPNKSEARPRAAEFERKWMPEHPNLVAIIRDDFEATLTFYDMNANTWKSLRSTNIIEQFNRELRRKFDDMGACRGDTAVTRTAGLVAMRLAKSWQSKVVRGFRTVTRTKTAS